jgi:16S rRNA (uracil1498-N3)-methyltransferase
MRRFYFEPKSLSGDLVVLSPEESRHVAKVLRLAVGEQVELLDGQGSIFRAEIVETGRRVALRLAGIAATAPAPGKILQVGQGILKGDKMDTVVQKCTELGVHTITPFFSSRCQGRLDPTQAGKKQERWRRIALEACKQCLRLRVPQVDAPLGYDELLREDGRRREETLRLLFWEEEHELHLHDIEGFSGASSITLLLGPEGGFSREEVEAARTAGFRTVSLGENILRAETATLTAVAVVQFLAGNL